MRDDQRGSWSRSEPSLPPNHLSYTQSHEELQVTLTEKLEKLRQGAVERIPAAARDIMHQATERLRTPSVMNKILKVGDPAPAFALVNTQGETVRSTDRLARGPLVATFYRGMW